MLSFGLLPTIILIPRSMRMGLYGLKEVFHLARQLEENVQFYFQAAAEQCDDPRELRNYESQMLGDFCVIVVSTCSPERRGTFRFGLLCPVFSDGRL